MLFAQAAGGPGGPPAQMWAVIAGVCACYGVFLLGIVIIIFFFLRTLSRALYHCHPDNRQMQPGLVYLTFIPCFGWYVWPFVVVIQVAGSLKLEFEERRLDEGETDYGRTIGLALCILHLIGSFVSAIPGVINPQLQLVGTVLSLFFFAAQLVLFVLYWVRIAGYSRQLADDSEEHGELADDDDGYDDEPETPAPTDRPPPLPPVDPPHDPPR